MADGAVNWLRAFFHALQALFARPATQRPSPPPTPVPAPSAGPWTASAFYAALNASLFAPIMKQSELAGVSQILDVCKGLPLSNAAYALATAYHETAHAMLPVKEIGSDDYFRRMYDIEGARPDVARALGNTEPGDGVRYCGRGYVQITGRKNYARAASEIGVDLVANPDLALQPVVAAQILRRGMVEGWFTGKTFDSFLTDEATEAQFVQARRIINGLDRASLIAGYAVSFQNALKAGQWT